MRFISLIFLLLAGILYLFVPYTYNLNYCVVQFIFALFSSILFLCYKSKEEGIFNFHLIFIFSYISVNFLHAIFVFPDDNIFPVFKFPYNYKIILFIKVNSIYIFLIYILRQIISVFFYFIQ